jgi:cation:H+ antiporter
VGRQASRLAAGSSGGAARSLLIEDVPSPVTLSPLLLWSLILMAALAVLIQASSWFTGAAERIGRALGMPIFLIGVTIVAVGTSLPELVASIIAVTRGASEVVTGNVVGSNIANLLLILGLAGVIAGRFRIGYDVAGVDLPFLAGSTFLLVLMLWDGEVGRGEAVLGLLGIGIYFGYALSSGVRGDSEGAGADDGRPPTSRWWRWGLILVGSGGLIYLGAHYTVEAVIELSTLLGIGREVIAASAVALGTSLPEVAVTVVATRRGRPELAVGNVLGSNVFNAFAVIGVSGLVGPLLVPASLLDLAVPTLVAATVLTVFMIMENELTRWEGWLLLLLYGHFLGSLFDLL